MSKMISTCLSAAGIDKVVWIDDFFASPSRDELAESIYKHIQLIKEKGTDGIKFPPFDKLDLTQPKNAIEDTCADIMEGLSDAQLGEAIQNLAGLSGMTTPTVISQPDLSTEDFKELQEAFGSGLRTFSLGQWTSVGEQEFKGASDDTLFLVDKEFGREVGGIDGTSVLGGILNTTTAFCIMLTHTCTEMDQEERRLAIADSGKLEPHKFCVLSKQQSTDLPIDPRFARAIRAAMTHRFSGEIAHAICKTIQQCAGETARELTKQSVSDLERALFDNSNEEGVIEYDVVLRVFQIEQQYALNLALQDESVQKRLRASRKFRRSAGMVDSGSAQASMSSFRGWRKREVFQDGTGLNKLHAPLACGDVFEADTGTRYLFLAQSCDVMIRDDGKRRAEVGMLVVVNEVVHDQKQESTSGSRFFEIKGVFGNDKIWQIDFQNLCVVDLSILDFTVFNSDGSVQLSRDHAEPSMVLTKGWSRRLKRAKSFIFPNDSPPLTPTLGIGKHTTALKCVLTGDLLRYPIRRNGRIEAATATAILAAWATFQTRAALDHDFAAGPGT